MGSFGYPFVEGGVVERTVRLGQPDGVEHRGGGRGHNLICQTHPGGPHPQPDRSGGPEPCGRGGDPQRLSFPPPPSFPVGEVTAPLTCTVFPDTGNLLAEFSGGGRGPHGTAPPTQAVRVRGVGMGQPLFSLRGPSSPRVEALKRGPTGR